MTLIKILLFAALALLVLRIVLRAIASQKRISMEIDQGPTRHSVVPCARCGVYVPRERALVPHGGSAFYCSPECSRQANEE